MGYLADISFFGDVAAEQDATILDYFVRTPAVDAVESARKHLVLGRKGSGKTALVRYFTLAQPQCISSALNLRNYPWNTHKERVNLGASEIESYVSSWRYLIAVKANALLLEHAKFKMIRDSQKAAYNFLTDNYGGARPDLGEILRPKAIKLSKSSFKPSFMGASLGQVDFESEKGGLSSNVDLLTDALLLNATVMMGQSGIKRLFLHFDELDQGLSTLDEKHERMLIGLVLAARSIFSDEKTLGKICPIAYLRTDLWEAMKFSDKNKITQSSAVQLEWNTNTLRELIDRRIEAKVGSGIGWDQIEDGLPIRGSQSKWGHIIARTFLRPRDVIQFLNFIAELALRTEPDADIIENTDIVAAREPYSKYLKQELDDEINPHWDKWAEALQAISEITTLTFSRDEFEESWGKRKASKTVPADQALETLYQYSVVGYRRGIGKGGSGWTFQYTDPDAGWDNAASRLKAHPGLKEFAKLRETRGDS